MNNIGNDDIRPFLFVVKSYKLRRHVKQKYRVRGSADAALF
jgi:hypothetical protein